MSNFRWGILGTGGIARAFARDLQLLEGHTVAAVGSRTIDTSNSFAKNFSGCIAYGSYQELVNSVVVIEENKRLSLLCILYCIIIPHIFDHFS